MSKLSIDMFNNEYFVAISQLIYEKSCQQLTEKTFDEIYFFCGVVINYFWNNFDYKGKYHRFTFNAKFSSVQYKILSSLHAF